MLCLFHFRLTDILREKNPYFGKPLFCKKRTDNVWKTSCSRLRVQDFATDENFSFNQCHNKEFQLAIFSVDISKKKIWNKVCVRKGLNISKQENHKKQSFSSVFQKSNMNEKSGLAVSTCERIILLLKAFSSNSEVARLSEE